jgi:hypothetical protein
VPLDEWLELAPAEASSRLPFVRAAAPDGSPLRLVVSRSLALAALDRRAFWRTLGELAGVRSEPLATAAASARREAEERAGRELGALLDTHRAELDRVRAEAAGALVERLVGGLLRSDGGRGSA